MNHFKRGDRIKAFLFDQIKSTQRENIITAGKMIADTIDAGGNIYLSGICHSIEMDLFN
ncbi:MAG: hypothetical protein J6K75_03060 [Erysipelotrichaceae bacterium]|nr:hypothetical protein [Erysipelotrichaceae bacterium]